MQVYVYIHILYTPIYIYIHVYVETLGYINIEIVIKIENIKRKCLNYRLE